MARDRWLTAWLLGSVALGGASLSVPLYFVTVDGRAALLGLLVGATAAGAPGALLVGRLADRSDDRRRYVLAALAFVAIVLAVVPFTSDGWLLVGANAAIWFAAGVAAPVLTLLVTVGHPEGRWSERFAVLDVYGGWGWAGGLVLGAVWTGLGTLAGFPALAQRSLFLLLAGCAAAAAAVGWARLPADPQPVTDQRADWIAGAVARTRRLPVRSATVPTAPGRLYWLTRSIRPRGLVDDLSPGLRRYLLAVLVVFVGFGAFWGPLPLFLVDRVDYAASVVFGLYLASSLGAALLFRRAGRIAAARDAVDLQSGSLLGRSLLQPAVALLVLPAGALAVAVHGVLFVLLGIAWAFVAVTATTVVSRLAAPEDRGQALGLYTAVSGLAFGAGAALGGLLATAGFTVAFVVAGGLVLVGTALVWQLRERATDADAEPGGEADEECDSEADVDRDSEADVERDSSGGLGQVGSDAGPSDDPVVE